MLWFWLTAQAFAADHNVDVGDDWCATLAAAAAGDRVLLAPGTHFGPCSVTPAGEAGNPIVLSVQDTEARAVVQVTEGSDNLLDLHAGHIEIEGIDFGATPANVEAIRLHVGAPLSVRDCTFDFTGSQAIVANTAGVAYSAIIVEDSVFTNLSGAAVTVGCFAGESDCSATDVVIQRNRITGVTGGAGIVLEQDAVGQVVHNSVSGTLGPAVRVGGDVAEAGGVEAPAEGDLPSTIVASNHLVGSGNGATLTIDGGPVLVRNNVVTSGALGAFVAADPSSADRMDHIYVVGNTFGGGAGPAVSVSEWLDTATLSFQNNGVWDPNTPGAGVPTAIGTHPWTGNVACSSETSCFEDLTGGNPSPRAGGELVGMGVVVEDGLLDVDLCGSERADGDPSGALVSSLEDALNVAEDRAPTVHCATGGDTGIDSGIDSGEPESGPRPGQKDWTAPTITDTYTGPAPDPITAAEVAGETGGISCATGGAATGWVAILIGLVAAGRRER